MEKRKLKVVKCTFYTVFTQEDIDKGLPTEAYSLLEFCNFVTSRTTELAEVGEIEVTLPEYAAPNAIVHCYDYEVKEALIKYLLEGK